MKRIVVLGGGESGYGAAILASVKGFDIFLSDRGTIPEKYKQELAAWEIPFEEGGHTEALIFNASEVIKSPGIPEKAPIVQALRKRGIPIISEIEFAGRYAQAKTICITGSNGKTTTTTLTSEIMRDAGYAVGLGGNIGRSFAYMVALEDEKGRKKAAEIDSAGDLPEPPEWYVLELSSFQLDGMYDFRADVAMLLNITPDHLDSYDYQMQRYVESKFRIIRNQRPEDIFIYGDDDPVIAGEMANHNLPMRRWPFSARHVEIPGAWLDGGRITTEAGGRQLVMEMQAMQLQGIHNAYNAMAAALAALSVGVPEASIRTTLASFRGVEHRMEPAGEIDGVAYINDSKATNVDSVWYALESMTHPVVWIAGGTDKGNDYGPLLGFAREKVKRLVCMGVDNTKLEAAFAGAVPEIISTSSLESAMQAAQVAAQPGDVVLLSPACASFDLFKNYEDRGRQFKTWVKTRKQQQKDGGDE